MLYPKQSQTRCVLDLNGIWDLAREHEKCGQEDGFEAEKKVAVPCSYNDLYAEEGFRMWSGGVWYSRTFVVPRALRGERLVLRFGSVAYSAEVYVNGLIAGAHAGGHTPFECDVTQLVTGGDNLLCVRGQNTLSAETVPMGGLNNAPENGQFAGQYPDVPFDFFPYGGIQRNVCLYTTSPRGWISDIRVVTTIDGATGRVSIQGAIDGARSSGGVSAFARDKGVAVRVTVDGATTDAALGRRFATQTSQSFDADLAIEDCKFWGVGAPNLYVATIALVDGAGEVVDEYAQRFGVRTIAVAGDRLLLNGAPVYLQGFGRHEDFPIVGKGLCHGVNVRDHELLRWINANSYRTTHYPYSEELVALISFGSIVERSTKRPARAATARLLMRGLRLVGAMAGFPGARALTAPPAITLDAARACAVAMPEDAPRIVMGSKSASRRALLAAMGCADFEVRVPDIDEKAIGDRATIAAEDLVLAVARAKMAALTFHSAARSTAWLPAPAQEAAATAAREALLSAGFACTELLLCADQVVRCEGRIREKPVDATEAERFVRSYSAGAPAECVNGLVLHDLRTGASVERVQISKVHLRPMADDVIKAFAAEPLLLTCAGALMIEHPSVKVRQLEGG